MTERARRATRRRLSVGASAALAAVFALASVAGAAAAPAHADAHSAPAARAARVANPNPYRDIGAVTPLARTAILADANLGIMTGTAPGRFDPDGLVTRAQAVRLILGALVAARALPAPPTARAPLPFADVSRASPYDPSLAAALRLGIVAAPAAGAHATFAPTAPVRRADLAAWALAASLQAPSSALADPYRDLGQLAPSARAAVLSASALGLVPPAGRQAWDPGGPVRRADMAITLLRLYRLVAATLPAAVELTASQPTVATGTADPLAFTVTDRAGQAIPSTRLGAYTFAYRVVAGQGGVAATAAVKAGAFTAQAPGSYGLTLTVSGGYLAKPVAANLATPIVVYGGPAQIAVQGPATLTADGLDGAAVTLTVEDAGGRTVANYDGTITVASTAPSAVGIVGPQGAVATAPLTVVAHNGVAQLSVRAGHTAAAQAEITALAADGVVGSLSVATVAQLPTRVAVEAATPAVAQSRGATDLVAAAVVDQAGFPMASGTYPLEFSLKQGSPAAVTFQGRGGGPVSLTYVGGSARPPTVTLVTTGAASGSVEVDVTTSTAGVAAGSATVTVVSGAVPPGQAGTVNGLSLAPESGSGATVAVGGVALFTLSYTGQSASPEPAPAPIAVTLAATAAGTGQVAFTDLPTGATTTGAGASATLTLPAGTASVAFGLAGLAAGEVTVTAQGSLTAPGATAPTAVSAALPVSVTGPAENPVTGVELTAGTSSSTIGEGASGGGVPVTVSAAGDAVPVTVTLVGDTGQPVFAPENEVVILSDQGLAQAADGSRVPANTMSAGGVFQVSGAGASTTGGASTQVLVIPAGDSNAVVTYTNQTPGTYTLEAEVLDLTASGLSPSAAAPGAGSGAATATAVTYDVTLAAVGIPTGDVLGNLSDALTVTSNRLAAVPTGEQVSVVSGSAYAVHVPWPGTPPPADSLYAQIAGVAPTGPVTVPLGPPPAPALSESLAASSPSLTIPAAAGQATITYSVTDASGKPVAGAQVQVVLTNAAGANLSLAPGGTRSLENVTTSAAGTATVTVYGSQVPDVGTLTATLPSEPALAPVTTPVSVVASGADQIAAPATELGATQFTADQGGEPLAFYVTTAGSAPAAGVTVDFALAVGSNGLSLSAASAKTNAQGLAIVRVRGYTTSAQGAVVAWLPTVPGATVTTGPITVTAGRPVQFAASLPPGDTIRADVAARGVTLLVVLEDQYGNPVPGPVSLAVSATGPLALASGQTSVLTTQAGGAAIALKDPTGALGQSEVVVADPAVPGLSTSVPLTVVSGPPAKIAVQPLSTTTTQAGGDVGIAVTATDAFGNPVSGTYPVVLGGSATNPSPNGTPAGGTVQSVTFVHGSPVQPIVLSPVLAQAAASVTVSVAGLAPVAVPGTLAVASADAAYAVVTSLTPAAAAAAPTLTPTAAVGPWQGTLYETVSAPEPKTAYAAAVQLEDVYGNPVATSGMAIDVAMAPEAGGGATLSATALSTDANGRAAFTYTTSTAASPKPAHGDSLSLTLVYTGATTTLTTGGY